MTIERVENMAGGDRRKDCCGDGRNGGECYGNYSSGGSSRRTRCILHNRGIFSGSIEPAGRRNSRGHKKTPAENVNFPAEIRIKKGG